MSIYIPKYKDFDTSVMPNCLCGDSGKNRNERECVRQGGCTGCGFDINEHRRRLMLIQSGGLRPISEKRKQILRSDWGMNTNLSLVGLRVGKKRAKKTELG